MLDVSLLLVSPVRETAVGCLSGVSGGCEAGGACEAGMVSTLGTSLE